MLKQYKECKNTYVAMARSFNLQEGKKIAKYIFGMILMPMEVNRKKIMEYIEGFEGILEQYESTEVDRRKLYQYKHDSHDSHNKSSCKPKGNKWINPRGD